ncbi:hypothetical protein PLEI_3275 [Photobacterium leiognathi lrivu.4.1]|uniref:Uncharacterized protein n=1 Tax=Photobacterium leiognathi lrivu.4.1 TaxID=1248232 RepID=V5H3J9_PHOLE|nr:hypothetical protein PLEI_3275 [Photobacterium leiognathi lrivu.4.1]
MLNVTNTNLDLSFAAHIKKTGFNLANKNTKSYSKIFFVTFNKFNSLYLKDS